MYKKKFRNYVSAYRSKNLPLDIAKKEEEDMIILELCFMIFFPVDLHWPYPVVRECQRWGTGPGVGGLGKEGEWAWKGESSIAELS